MLEDLKIDGDKKIIEAMRKIDVSGAGIVIVVNYNGGVMGTVSDGDIRRAILRGIDVNEELVKNVVRNDPILLHQRDLLDKNIINMAALALFSRSPAGGFVPVLDEKDVLIDLIKFTELEKKEYKPVNKFNGTITSKTNVKKILIVGGGGYLGTVLTKKLLQKGYGVKVLDIFLFGKGPLKEMENHPGLEIIEGDIRNIMTVSEALHGVDAVIHLAAIVGDPACKTNPIDAIETNYLATKTLAEACKYRQINRFLFASTCSVYGRGDSALTEEAPLKPLSLYAKSKITSEEGILGLGNDNFAPCSLRMATLYGLSPRMRFDLVINTLTMKAVTEGKITIFGGNQWRPLLHVADAAEAYIKCIESPIENVRRQVFNVGSNDNNYQIIDLGNIVKKLVPGTEMEIVDNKTIDGKDDKRDYNVSFDKIRKTFGFLPQNKIENGIIEMKTAIEGGNFGNVKDPRYYNLMQE